MNIAFASTKLSTEMIQSFEVCQLLRNKGILNLDI